MMSLRKTSLCLTGLIAMCVCEGAIARAGAPEYAKASSILGPTQSGLPWHSGAWAPGSDGHTKSNLDQFEAWRGTKLDLVTAYANYTGKLSDAMNSAWSVSYEGPGRRLCYGVPLGGSDLSVSQVANGDGDAIYQHVAQLLTQNGRGDSIIRIGWEADIPNNWAWHRNASNCDDYKQAWTRVRNIFASYSSNFKFVFEGNVGSHLEGASSNEAWLTLGYPGDNVVDLVGCDVYNAYSTAVKPDDTGWNSIVNPSGGLGLQDVADFARSHNKGLIIPEWGLHGEQGSGDVPQFIEDMQQFFVDNKDIMAAECYFNEPDAYIHNALWMDGNPSQNPQSASEYLQLFGAAAVPEPGSLGLLSVCGLFLVRRREEVASL